MPLALTQLLYILGCIQSDSSRIVHLLIEYATYVFFRQSRSVVDNRNLYIIIVLCSVNRYVASCLSILTGIIGQRIYHEKRKSLIRLYYSLCRRHSEINIFGVESMLSLSHHSEQIIKTEVLYFEAQRTLPHLNP